MPNINEIAQKKRKFVKDPYRAWNFSSNADKATVDASTIDLKTEQQEEKSNNHAHDEPNINDPLAEIKQPVSKALATREQPVSEALATREQPVSEALATREQPVSKALATREQPVSKALATREQPVSKPVSKPVSNKHQKNRLSPTGKELELLFFLQDLCAKNCSLITQEVATKKLTEFLGVNSNRLRNIVSRVTKKNWVNVIKQNCSGTNAYRVFEFTRSTYDNLLQKQTTSLYSHIPLADPLASTTVVSSSYINTTTNLGLDIPKNWEGISIDALEHIGFSKSHLVQIYRQYEKNPEGPQLSPELIQSSIDAFAFDLKYNNTGKEFKKEPAVVLLSLLKKAQPYNSVTPGKCVSPVQDALNKHQQMLEEQRIKELQLKQKIKDSEFLLWQESLSEKELLALCPELEVSAGISDTVKKAMHRRKALEFSRDYFDANIWAGIEQKILGTVTRKQTANQEETVLKNA